MVTDLLPDPAPREVRATIVSVDDHLVEPPGLFEGRLPTRFADISAIAGFLVCLSLPVFPHDWQAYGNNLLATVVMAAGLAWHLLYPAEDKASSLTAPAGSLSASGRVP